VRTAVTHGHAWTSEQDTELREGVDLGLTLEEVAEHLELDEAVITARLRLIGLELSDSPKMAVLSVAGTCLTCRRRMAVLAP
jgi:ATP-dependent DNA helicase DinG